MKSFAEPGSRFWRVTPLCLGLLCVSFCLINLNLKRINVERLRHSYGCPYFGGREKSSASTSPRGGKGWSLGQPTHVIWGRGPRNCLGIRVLIFFPVLLCAPFLFSNPARPGGTIGGNSFGPGAGRSVHQEPCGPEAVRLPPAAGGNSGSGFLFRHGEILVLCSWRWLLSCISGFAFAFLWLPGELNCEEMVLGVLIHF